MRVCVCNSRETLRLANKKIFIYCVRAPQCGFSSAARQIQLVPGFRISGGERAKGGGESRGRRVERPLSRRVGETFVAITEGREQVREEVKERGRAWGRTKRAHATVLGPRSS